MSRLVTRRLLHALPVLLIVTFATALFVDFLPGDPGAAILGTNATPEDVARLDRELGVDRPVMVRYLSWLGGLLHGDLGTSYRTSESVRDVIMQRLPVTAEIGVLALLIALLLATPTALWAASRERGLFDRTMGITTSGLLSVPAFIGAPLLALAFAVQLRFFPVTGWSPLSQGLDSNLRSAFLPALALALPELAVFNRVLRAELGSTLREEYIRLARAKGLSTWYVLHRHALRPSSLSLLTLAGLSLGRVLGGAVVVENLFALPGLGQLIVQSIYAKDIVVVQGTVAFIAVVYILVNTLVDMAYTVVDPRLRSAAA
jgi:peptide/nickel transport system permease protein